MRKRTSPAILERAIIAVPGFESVLTRLSQQVTLRGQSESALSNYDKHLCPKCKKAHRK